VIILALDSASTGCAVALWQDGRVLAEAHETMERGQDARLVPLTLEVLAQAKLDFPHIDRLAVTRGPGSFTGVRIGLSAARGFGLAAGKPVVGLDRFTLYDKAFPTGGLLTVLESRREELYCRLRTNDGTRLPPDMQPPGLLEDWLAAQGDLAVAGDATAFLDGVCLHPRLTLPKPEVLLAAELAATLNPRDALPTPLYLRAPDVTLPAPKSIGCA
jgi:tRNA threonylcarbamoyl adenosine modification protein YeaZ